MNGFAEEYKRKLIAPEEIADVLRPGARVFIEQGPAEPLVLVDELCRSVHRLREIQIMIVPITGVNMVPFAKPEYTNHWQIFSFLGTRNLRTAISENRAEYVPIHVSEIPSALYGRFRPDVSMIQVTPPDSFGFCNFGIEVDYNRAAVDGASITIAQVNSCMPVMCGDTSIHISEIDYFVEKNSELIELPPTEPNEVEKKIAVNVADLVHNGSTIQIGVGELMDVILIELRDKCDLGIHSGLLSDRMLDLIEFGAVTGMRKNINPRKVVAAMLLGTERLYRSCERNTLIELYPVSYTHNRSVISKIENFVSINSSIEIDLTGQVNSEAVNDEIIAGVGGQFDFVRIGRLSPGGKSILAIPSMSKGRSRIVPQLEQGSPVSTARVDVDLVVTEFGVADLRHRSLRERAKALVDIAHPDAKNELRHATHLVIG